LATENTEVTERKAKPELFKNQNAKSKFRRQNPELSGSAVFQAPVFCILSSDFLNLNFNLIYFSVCSVTSVANILNYVEN
jgi:hypothetical protein